MFKTDPKNTDYELESGATRNFELWRENEEVLNEEAKLKESDEKYDSMKSLENRTLDSKVEMDILDALDEIKAINQRHENVNTNAVLDSLNIHNKNSKIILNSNGITENDELLLKTIKFASKNKELHSSDENDSENEKNGITHQNHMIDTKLEIKLNSNNLINQIQTELMKNTIEKQINMPIIIKKKRKINEINNNKSIKNDKTNNETNNEMIDISIEKKPNIENNNTNNKIENNSNLMSLFGDYGNDSE